ncbi:hypothetical protein SAMN02787073_2977 [Chryseobacterium vrystaatense]|uniref:Uncharacterized protein n=1 Tax=Chryseobacterium vrystaatense TaxID=307480 RepID=A0A1M5EP35_9FLAO|nr:hypothetical protein SAMN02787073_2977 [Chryseobacterium vrystaatense]
MIKVNFKLVADNALPNIISFIDIPFKFEISDKGQSTRQNISHTNLDFSIKKLGLLNK